MSNQPRSGLWARFSARFDDVLMSAPVADLACPPPAACADDHAMLSTLRGLCPAGAWAAPGFASASHTLAAQPAARAQQQAWLQHQLLALDGTLHMLQLGGAGRQRLHRLAIKLRELMHEPRPGGPATASLPWDCGWLNPGPAAQAQVARFVPRRPTLLLAWQLPASTVAPAQAALQQRGPAYAHPVRLWLLNAPDAGAAATPCPL